jgi:hypothetical protein
MSSVNIGPLAAANTKTVERTLFGHSVRGAAIGIGVTVGVLVLVAIVMTLVFVFHIQVKGPDLRNAPVRVAADVPWRDGDLILTQHRAYNLDAFPIVHRMPVHVGLIWNHPTFGPCVVDTHEAHRQDEQMPDALTNTRPRAGTRIVRVADYLKEYDGKVFRRPVVQGVVNNAALSDAVEGWALYQPFDPWVSKGQPLYIAAIGLSSMLPGAALALARMPGPSHDRTRKRLRGVYCTELAAKLLQKAGAIDPAYHAHVCSPLAFTSSSGQIDKAARVRGIAWGPEERIVYKSA